jgi:hypothetical protein
MPGAVDALCEPGMAQLPRGLIIKVYVQGGNSMFFIDLYAFSNIVAECNADAA